METHEAQEPPASAQRIPRRRKKQDDPFLKLAEAPISASPPATEPTESAEPGESLLTRLILTPLYLLSTLLSLLYITHRDLVRRTHRQTPSFLSYLNPTSYIRIDPSPYQDPNDTTWNLDHQNASPNDVLRNRDSGGRGWFLRKKIRKMRRLEVGDALEMRGRVLLGLAAVAIIGISAFAMGFRWVMRWLW